MSFVKSTISLKWKIQFSNFWIRNGFFIIILSFIINHLFQPEYFPFNANYEFPLLPITVSIIAGFIVLYIAELNFRYFKNKYFIQEINFGILSHFLLSTLGYITLFYLLLYYSLNGLINGIESYRIYHLLTGLSVSLLLCTIGIALLFSGDIYRLDRLLAQKDSLKVEQSGKITLIQFTDIAFLYSENKTVYLVKTNGITVHTDFTLKELMNLVGQHGFYRANRQTIVHVRAIEQLQSIENGKLSVLLKPIIAENEAVQINVSRYKKQEFMQWFNSGL